MKLLHFKRRKCPPELVGDDWPDAWQWALYAHACREGVSIALRNEVLRDGTWTPAREYFSAGITREWSFGENHIPCDGPNCVYSLGFFHFAKSYGPCAKCDAEE